MASTLTDSDPLLDRDDRKLSDLRVGSGGGSESGTGDGVTGTSLEFPRETTVTALRGGKGGISGNVDEAAPEAAFGGDLLLVVGEAAEALEFLLP